MRLERYKFGRDIIAKSVSEHAQRFNVRCQWKLFIDLLFRFTSHDVLGRTKTFAHLRKYYVLVYKL